MLPFGSWIELADDLPRKKSRNRPRLLRGQILLCGAGEVHEPGLVGETHLAGLP